MDMERAKSCIERGQAVLGIELGSTRIKAVLIDENHAPIAQGSQEWENHLVDGIWTYGDQEIWDGLRACYADLKAQVKARFGLTLKRVKAMGFSAMMHGYLAFDQDDRLLVPFRTWRNTITGPAADELTRLFNFNIPQRWSVAHLYQAILNGEAHVPQIRFITTLSGYVHYRLTGRRVLGVGDASGMFPIDSAAGGFDASMMRAFDAHISGKGFPWKLEEILPQVLSAGQDAGTLTPAGARLLDPQGDLEEGIPLCPPEGDAGTGMTATGSVRARTGNVSAGTSIFAMIVLEKPVSKVHTEINMVTTPSGAPVAMAHCNNCTSDLNAWVGLFAEFLGEMGVKADMGRLFETLYTKALTADPDLGGLMAYNYYSGEPMTGLENGRPLFMRMPDSRFTLANFMCAHLYSALASLKLGMDILTVQERVKIDSILGHGGFFKTKGVGQRMLAAALNLPVSVMETAGEGGAWGMALLADYAVNGNGMSLEDYLDQRVFTSMKSETLAPEDRDVQSFAAFMERYTACLPVERAAAECMK